MNPRVTACHCMGGKCTKVQSCDSSSHPHRACHRALGSGMYGLSTQSRWPPGVFKGLETIGCYRPGQAHAPPCGSGPHRTLELFMAHGAITAHGQEGPQPGTNKLRAFGGERQLSGFENAGAGCSRGACGLSCDLTSLSPAVTSPSHNATIHGGRLEHCTQKLHLAT